MKRVNVTGRDERIHSYIIRDIDDESKAASIGIPDDPPCVDEILDNVKVLLHNELVNRGLFTLADIQNAQTGISEAIVTVLKNRILQAYIQKNKDLEVNP